MKVIKRKLILSVLISVLFMTMESNADEQWVCENGHKNMTGNFCSECGIKKADNGIWICPEGHEGQTGNFCTVCGTKRPEARADTDLSSAGESDSYDSSTEAYTAVQTGQTIMFGSYEQDENPLNGTEPIEWIVLDTVDKDALVISKYGLEAESFHDWSAITWEESNLRKWLNSTFIENAFSVTEQEKIKEVTNTNLDNYETGTAGGVDTVDKVFLLSVNEAEKYFYTNTSRRAMATTHVVANGVSNYRYDGKQSFLVNDSIHNYQNSDGSAGCSWWLRTPGMGHLDAVKVDGSGVIDLNGDPVSVILAVRPAMWINY